MGQSQKTSKLHMGQGLVLKIEQYWIDEQNISSIELVKLPPLYQNALRKQIYITCKAQTSLGQSEKTHKLHLCWVRQGLVLKNRAILDG
jgi:hypothetical protein